MSVDESIREIVGELRGEVHGLAREIGQMRKDNSDEHRAVIQRMNQLDGKVDALEGDRDRKLGRNALLNGIALAIASLFGAIFGSHT